MDDRIAIGIIGIVFILGVIAAWPVGEYPINDDWAYALSAQHFASTGEFRNMNWSPMTLVLQTAWGGMFIWMFGDSFTVLRMSTLVLALGVLICTFLLMRELRVQTKMALLGTLFLLFNPLFFNLAGSFMTEIPFMFFMVLSTLLFCKAMKSDATPLLVIASLIAMCGFLIRQPGVLVPCAAAAYLWWSKKLDRKRFVAIMVPVVVIGLSFVLWYYGVHGPTYRYTYLSSRLISILLPARIAYNGFILCILVGFFTLPFALLSLKGVKWKVLAPLFMLFALGCCLFPLASHHWPTEGIVSTAGFGIMTPDAVIPDIAFGIAALLGSCSIAALLAFGWSRRHEIAAAPNMLITLVGGVFTLYLCVSPGFFDRYLLVVLPFILCLLLVTVKSGRLAPLLMAGVVISCVFSVTLERDLFSYNDARWSLLDELKQDHSVHDIDGGFEFNGYYLSEYLFRTSVDKVNPKGRLNLTMVDGDAYTVSSEVKEGYRMIDRRDFSYLWGLRSSALYSLELINASTGAHS